MTVHQPLNPFFIRAFNLLLTAAVLFSALFSARSVQALPSAAGISGYQTGQLDQTELGYTLGFDVADLGRPFQVYVVLQVDQAAFALNAAGQFVPLAAGPLPFVTVVPTTTRVKRTLASNIQLLDLPAFKLYVGYGQSWDEMLQAQRVKQVFPEDDGTSPLPALPLPLTPLAQKTADDLLLQLTQRLKRVGANSKLTTCAN